MSESRKSKTKIEKPKEEKKMIEEELTKATTKQEQIDPQLQEAKNLADYLKDYEQRSWILRLVIKGAIVEGIAPYLKYSTDQEFYDLMNYVFSIPTVQGFIMEQQEKLMEEECIDTTGTR
jgi:hypothetical protein